MISSCLVWWFLVRRSYKVDQTLCWWQDCARQKRMHTFITIIIYLETFNRYEMNPPTFFFTNWFHASRLAKGMLFIKCEGRCSRTDVLGQLEVRSRTGFVRFNHVRRSRVFVRWNDFPCLCRKEQRSTHLGRQRSIHACVHHLNTGQSIHLHFHNMKQLCKKWFQPLLSGLLICSNLWLRCFHVLPGPGGSTFTVREIKPERHCQPF